MVLLCFSSLFIFIFPVVSLLICCICGGVFKLFVLFLLLFCSLGLCIVDKSLLMFACSGVTVLVLLVFFPSVASQYADCVAPRLNW